jgi:hypothetical protein
LKTQPVCNRSTISTLETCTFNRPDTNEALYGQDSDVVALLAPLPDPDFSIELLVGKIRLPDELSTSVNRAKPCPASPVAPEVPLEPELPEFPDEPDVPEEPDEPSVPDEPEIPEVPLVPVEPENCSVNEEKYILFVIPLGLTS